jgi:phage shock protein A
MDASRRTRCSKRSGRPGPSALTEKQSINDKIEHLKHETKSLDGQLAKFNDDISKLQSKLGDAKKRQRSITIRHKTATSQLAARKHIHNDKIDEMLFRFENAEKKIDRVESEGEAMDIGRRDSLVDEIEGLEDDDRVEDALKELKSKVNEPGKATKPKPKAKKKEENNNE